MSSPYRRRPGRLLVVFLLCLAAAGGARASADAVQLVKAGLAAQKQGEWGRAIDLYTQALAAEELSPADSAQVAGLLANAYGAAGNPEEAVAGFTRVIELAPGSPAPLVGRGIAYRQKGDYDRALADDDAALALAPDYVVAHANRGLTNFEAGRFAAAAADFEYVHMADPAEADFVLWLYLSQARAGHADKDELARNAAKLDLGRWSGPAVALFLGRVEPDALRAAADDPNPAIRLQHRCEAIFYLGEQALLGARPEPAKTLFKEVLETCAAYKPNYAYFSQAYGAAAAELKRLAK